MTCREKTSRTEYNDVAYKCKIWHACWNHFRVVCCKQIDIRLPTFKMAAKMAQTLQQINQVRYINGLNRKTHAIFSQTCITTTTSAIASKLRSTATDTRIKMAAAETGSNHAELRWYRG